jgi:hypothetical protein
MKFLRPQCKVEMLSASGILRVTITPQFNVWVVVELVGFIAFFAILWKQSPNFYRENPVFWTLFLLALLRGFWYQVSGSEEIEFSQQRLLLHKDRPLWPLNREYPLAECSGLQTLEPSEDNSDTLSCRVGTTRVTFGANLSSEQADSIIIELQRALPDAADQLLSSPQVFGKHFTTLNLS